MVENNNGDLTHFKWWTVECLASMVVIFSYYDEFTTSRIELSTRDIWILYSSIGSALISIVGLVVCLLPIERRACSLESLLVWFIAILRSTTTIVGIIGRYRTDVEVTLLSSYRLLTFNPNVYFFSLWALMASILMVASWYKEFIHIGTEWKTSTQWILLGAMSFFTMLSALVFRDQTVLGEFTNAAIYNISRGDFAQAIDSLIVNGTISNSTTIGNLTNDFLAHDERKLTDPAQAIFEALVETGVMETVSTCESPSYNCLRLHYAIGLSATTAAMAFFMAPITIQKFQLDVSIIFFVLWLTALPVLTVSPGPATRAGNLYFGIYICYFLVLNIFSYSVTFTSSSENTNEDADDLKDNGPINRDDLWNAAYGKLERNNSHDEDERGENDSWGSLFDEAEQWDDELEARISARASVISLEDRLALGGSFGKRMTTFYVSKLIPEDAAIISSRRNSIGFIKPKGWNRRARRFQMWCTLLSMAIVLAHTISAFGEGEIDTVILVWVSIAIFVPCVGLVTCFRSSSVSYTFQVASIITEVGVWAYGAVLFLQSQSAHMLGYTSAEDQVNILLGGKIQRLADDPNIFFGVWISVITVILLVTNICKASLITTDWLLLAGASVALLVSAAEYVLTEFGDKAFNFRLCDTEDFICTKFTFAMYLGLVSLCVSLLMTLLFRFKLGPTLHVIVSIPLVIAWGFGVPYVTFLNARTTPAAVYFAFWGGIFLALEIASINIIIMRRNKRKKEEDALAAEEENEDESFLSAIMKEESLPSLRESSRGTSANRELEIVPPPNNAQNPGSMLSSNAFDLNVSMESNLSNSQAEDDIIEDESTRDSPHSFIEIMVSKDQPDDEKLIETNQRDQSQILHTESIANGNELYSERSKASTQSSFSVNYYERKSDRDEGDSLIGAGAMRSLSRPSSVDTNDFEDCIEFVEDSSPFQSARSTTDIY